MATPIKINKVTKFYSRSKTPAVHDLTLSIKPGEVYGLIGANGAGKTTTLRLILDFIHPSSGTIRLLGKDIRQNPELSNRIGYLPGEVVLPKGATGMDFLTYLGKLSGSVDQDYMKKLAKRFDTQLDKKMSQLSKGNRQKIGIIQAFMHQPDVLILDEPTSGLDPLMQEQFYHTVSEARERGATILLSSHSFEEVERTCDRIGIMRKGKLVHEGLTVDVIATQKPRWRVTLKHKGDVEKLKINSALELIDASQNSLTVEPSHSIEKALSSLSQYPIISITTSQRGLEDEFLRFYEEETKL